MIYHNQEIYAICDMCNRRKSMNEITIPNGHEFLKIRIPYGLPLGWNVLNEKVICDNHDITIDNLRYDVRGTI